MSVQLTEYACVKFASVGFPFKVILFLISIVAVSNITIRGVVINITFGWEHLLTLSAAYTIYALAGFRVSTNEIVEMVSVSEIN